MQVKQRGREPWIQTGYRSHDQNFENIVVDSCANFRVCPFVAFHARSRKPRRSVIHSVKFSKWRTLGTMRTVARFTSPNFPNLNCKESVQNIDNNFLDDIFMYHNYFNNALGIQHHNFSIAIVLIFVRMAYVNVIATGIVFNIRASSSHIGLMMAFSEHRRSIIRVFDRRSIMNRLYWNNQQVVHLCFIPFVWEIGVSLPLRPIRLRWFHTFCPWAEPLGDGHEGMWARFGSQGSIALNWHLRYSGTRYSGTWLYNQH